MIRYTHTNIVTDDWKRLASFYVDVFGCQPLYPERDLRGQWLDKATQIENAHLTGIHLALPGYENNLPTLEIFRYDQNLASPEAQANREGLAHIAFEVDDVTETVNQVIQHGGSLLGDITETEIAGKGSLIFAYARDIDGNIVEIQKWIGK